MERNRYKGADRMTGDILRFFAAIILGMHLFDKYRQARRQGESLSFVWGGRSALIAAAFVALNLLIGC